MTRTLAVRIDTVRKDRTTGEIITDWSPNFIYPCDQRCEDVASGAVAPTQQAADVMRVHHTRDAHPDGTWRDTPDPRRPNVVVSDTIDWLVTATLVGDWTDAERAEIRRIVDRDRHLPGGG